MTAGDRVRAAIDAAARTHPRFVLHLDASPADGWVSCSDLLDDASNTLADHVERDLERRHLPPTARHRQAATLLAFQQYAHRVTGPAVASWALGGVLPDLAIDRVRMRFTNHRASDVAVAHLVDRAAASDADVVGHLLDDHLLRAAEAFGRLQRLGRRAYLGAIAASVAGAFAMLSAAGHDAAWCHRVGTRLLGADDRIRSLATIRLVEAPGITGVFHERATCCLAYELVGVDPSGARSLCSSCSLRSAGERDVAFREVLAARR